MKNNLLSLSQLTELWGIKYRTLQKMFHRKTIREVTYLGKERAIKLGLEWTNKSAPTPKGRPYISIDDPAIPDPVRKRYYAQLINEFSETKSLTGAGQSSPPLARAEEKPTHPPFSPQEELGSDKDLKSSPAVGKRTNFLPPKRTRDRRLPDSFAYKENNLLCKGASLKTPREEGTSSSETDLLLYRQLPDYARRQVDKYLPLIKETEGMTSAETKAAISEWNEKNPKLATSYRSLSLAKQKYRGKGIEGLASRRGRRAGHTIVKEEWLEYFKSLYLKEGAPSAHSCWLITRGKFSEEKSFPVFRTFLYQLRRQMPEESIYFARHGERAWNRKYGMYIERDYSRIKSGECFVSDHAQIDVAVFDFNEKPHFPWVTAWRDLKSGKWVSWLVHIEPPNSDHIFQSFYYALKDFGVPKHIYMDNGKDYRSKDFAGGRKAGKVVVEEKKTRTVCGLLGITPHFSLPYNPQSKTIERDFLKIKEQFSKHLVGYRGGNTKERPEILLKQIKQGALLNFNDFCNLLDMYIAHNLNKMPSNSKVLRGMCPDELYKLEAENSFIKPDQLSILCQRSSSDLTIGRNGVKDSKNDITYFAEWMFGVKGKKVYLRRDPTRMQQAFVFDSKTDEYLGSAWINEAVPAISEDDVSRGMLKEKMRTKKLARKISKVYAKPQVEVNAFEKVICMSNGVSMLNRKRGYTPDKRQKEVEVVESGFAKKVLEKEEKQTYRGRGNSSRILPSGKKIYQFVSDKERDEEADKEIMMNGKKKPGRP